MSRPSNQPTLWAQRSTDADVKVLVGLLRGSGWTTARELRPAGYTDRTLRSLASASEGRIVSGQRGYCLIEEASVDEARHAASWLRHQAAAMTRRAHEIEQAMHRRSASCC